jgi:hypothetical protein
MGVQLAIARTSCMGVKLGYLPRREEHIIKVCGNRVRRRISGLTIEEVRGDRAKVHYKFHNSYSALLTLTNVAINKTVLAEMFYNPYAATNATDYNSVVALYANLK